MHEAVRTILLGGLDPDALAWSRTVTVTTTRRALVSQTIRSLKGIGVWPLLDRFWMLAGENSLQGRTCWVSRATVSPTNSPTFTANRGYTGDGVSAYVDTNFNATAAGTKYGQNDASYGAWIMAGGGGGHFIANDNAAYSRFFAGSSNLVRQVEINQNSAGSAYNAGATTGFQHVQRTASGAYAAYGNSGVQEYSDTIASLAVPNHPFFILASPSGVDAATTLYAGQVGVGWVGKSMTVGQISAFYSVLRTHLTAIGAP